MGWAAVEDAVEEAKGQTWDGCHKIYLLMDDGAVADMRSYDYEIESPNLEQLVRWFEESCDLRFINSIEMNREDPNAGFGNLIAQFELEEDEEDEEDTDW